MLFFTHLRLLPPSARKGEPLLGLRIKLRAVEESHGEQIHQPGLQRKGHHVVSIDQWREGKKGGEGCGLTRVTKPLGEVAAAICPSEIAEAISSSVDLMMAAFASGSVSSAQFQRVLKQPPQDVAEASFHRPTQTARTLASSMSSIIVVQTTRASRRRSSLCG